ncbi:MAG: alanine--tRNA ligase [Candidatus Woesearchaeota archaeon]|jgi:alanyl-tRNA synthetase
MAMKTDKEIKKEFKIECSKSPDKFYPVLALKNMGFIRNQCDNCHKFFWNVDGHRKVCGDPSCSGGFDLSNGTPSKTKLSYVQVWKKIEDIFVPKGYKSIKRYPVTARWNPTCDFVMASIACFQPYVVTGEVDPPAKKLVIPQFCLRFSDVDNVGVTGSHCTGFVMIGQHAFMNEQEWNQEELFLDIYSFLIDGVGLDKKELTIHEDAWAGGGSFGPCMEFFSRGVELFNQVYTMFEQTPEGNRPLKLKVLDMGLGMERVAWFSQGTPNMYEAIFPQVLSKLRERTGVSVDHTLYKKFSKYSAYLNADEVEDLNVAWQEVASKMEISVDELKQKIWPNVGLYSVCEHARALLVALSDGALPSNTGGGYNLRIILRRALGFIDEFNWDVDLFEVMTWHAEELKELFPELNKNVATLRDVVDSERDKWLNSKQKSEQVVIKLISKEKVTEEDFLQLYDSQGIAPETIVNFAKQKGKLLKVPDNFYAKVSSLHEKQEQIHSTKRQIGIDLSRYEKTKLHYYDNYLDLEFDANVLDVLEGKYVILDKTNFYPTSGGQLHDAGEMQFIEKIEKVVDVFKEDNVVIHIIPNTSLKIGEKVHCIVDKKTRTQLSQHHTATHIVNAAAKMVLGPHINQAGAKKTLEKAHIDLTHYKPINEDEMKKIEFEANNIVSKNIKINKSFMKKRDAEDKYGMGLYQGGAIPGNELRIVEIPGVDVEACGGTHLNFTGECGKIKLLKTTKIQDGIVRVEFMAGEAAESVGKSDDEILIQIASELECSNNPKYIPSRCTELFTNWKTAKKLKEKGENLPMSIFVLISKEEFTGDLLKQAAANLSTQPQHVLKTILRFKQDMENFVIEANKGAA